MIEQFSDIERLNRQQAIEKRPVAAQGLPQIFGRDVVALGPIGLQVGTLAGKHFRETFYYRGYEIIRPFHRLPGLVYEISLDVLPPVSEILRVRSRD